MTTTAPRLPAGATGSGRDTEVDLHRVVAAQAEVIEQLQQRLDRLEVERSAQLANDSTPATNAAVVPSGLDTPTSRRNLMTKGAAAAATAVIGTAAVGLATASPAAASSGTFDGNPAVSAVASPTSGDAISATTVTGAAIRARSNGAAGATFGVVSDCSSPDGWAVYASNSATTGTATAVQGVAVSPAGVAIDGANNATSGAAIGLHGFSASSDGIAIRGLANATSGVTTGVQGLSNSSQNGRGVEGRNTATTGDTNGVLGVVDSTDGKGVVGAAKATTGAGYGVWGWSSSVAGTGTKGEATAATGVTTGVVGVTSSAQGTAVRALAGNNGTGVATTSDRTQLLFAGTPAAPPGAGLARVKGEMVFDTNADLWLCIAAGTPGTWRKVSGAATAGSFTVLPSTVRIYDSRAGLNPVGVVKGQLGNFAERTVDAKTNSAVPAGATAVLVNLTIVNTGDPGYLGLFKNGIPYPGNSTINWNQPGTLLANSAICALDDQARFAVKANVGFTDFVIDAIGYYR